MPIQLISQSNNAVWTHFIPLWMIAINRAKAGGWEPPGASNCFLTPGYIVKDREAAELGQALYKNLESDATVTPDRRKAFLDLVQFCQNGQFIIRHLASVPADHSKT